MVYGRVIGNELRDVPPECLPIWGQRWSGHRAPHGPSPFSIRIFTANGMSQVGPALTSPTQFEMTLTEEDEGQFSSPESNQFRSCFPSSPVAIRSDANGPTLRPEKHIPRSVHRSSNRPRDSPRLLNQDTRRLPLRISTAFDSTLLPTGRQSIHGGDGSLDGDYALLNMDFTSAGIQPQTNRSNPSQNPGGYLQYTMPLYPIPERQLPNADTQSSVYPFQFNPSPQPGTGCLSPPSGDDDRTSFVATTSSFSASRITTPQIPVNDPPWNHESRITTIPDIEDPGYLIPMPLQESALSFPGFLQDSRTPLRPGVFYHLVSGCHENSTHSESLLGTLGHAEGCTIMSLDQPGYLDPGGEQFAR